MIPIIGVMIGLYILTRMVELIASSQKPIIRILGAVTAAGNTVGILLLIGSSTSLSDFGSRSSTIATSPPTLSSLMDSATTSGRSLETWAVIESTNPLDDSPTVILRLKAASGHSRMGEAPALVLRCSRKKTDAYINWSDFLGSDETTVTLRIGKVQAETRSWTLSTDKTATFYPSGAVAFIKSLMRVDTVVASTTPYNESPVTAIFVVTGLTEKIAPLQKACGWT